MRIVIEPYKPEWETEFCRVQHDLHSILKDIRILSIEHVGSTAIPGLLAKPVLDIDIVVMPETLTTTRDALVSAGYIDLGEMGVPGRVAFGQPGYGQRQAPNALTEENSGGREMRRNTYVILEGSVALRKHRDLKTALLGNSTSREEYGEVKKQLAARELENVDEYCRGKNQVLLKILKSAGWRKEDLEEVRKAND